MSSQKLNVAIVGATGQLGKEIALALSQKPSIHLKILARPEGTKPITLPEGSYELVKVDFNDLPALTAALKDVHTVISSVNGGPETYINLQQNLLQASVAAGVKRFAPASFGADARKLSKGDLGFYDIKIPVDHELEKQVAAGTIKPLWFAVGLFLDLALYFFIQDRDQATAKFEYWGSGNDTFHVTAMSDIGRFVAAVVANPENSGWFLVGGQEISFLQLADIYEELTGKKVTRIQKGNIEEVRAKIAELKKDPALFIPTAIHQFFEIATRGALSSKDNQNNLLGEGYKFKGFKEAYAGRI